MKNFDEAAKLALAAQLVGGVKVYFLTYNKSQSGTETLEEDNANPPRALDDSWSLDDTVYLDGLSGEEGFTIASREVTGDIVEVIYVK